MRCPAPFLSAAGFGLLVASCWANDDSTATTITITDASTPSSSALDASQRVSSSPAPGSSSASVATPFPVTSSATPGTATQATAPASVAMPASTTPTAPVPASSNSVNFTSTTPSLSTPTATSPEASATGTAAGATSTPSPASSGGTPVTQGNMSSVSAVASSGSLPRLFSTSSLQTAHSNVTDGGWTSPSSSNGSPRQDLSASASPAHASSQGGSLPTTHPAHRSGAAAVQPKTDQTGQIGTTRMLSTSPAGADEAGEHRYQPPGARRANSTAGTIVPSTANTLNSTATLNIFSNSPVFSLNFSSTTSSTSAQLPSSVTASSSNATPFTNSPSATGNTSTPFTKTTGTSTLFSNVLNTSSSIAVSLPNTQSTSTSTSIPFPSILNTSSSSATSLPYTLITSNSASSPFSNTLSNTSSTATSHLSSMDTSSSINTTLPNTLSSSNTTLPDSSSTTSSLQSTPTTGGTSKIAPPSSVSNTWSPLSTSDGTSTPPSMGNASYGSLRVLGLNNSSFPTSISAPLSTGTGLSLGAFSSSGTFNTTGAGTSYTSGTTNTFGTSNVSSSSFTIGTSYTSSTSHNTGTSYTFGTSGSTNPTIQTSPETTSEAVSTSTLSTATAETNASVAKESEGSTSTTLITLSSTTETQKNGSKWTETSPKKTNTLAPTFDKLSEAFGWRKPGQRRVRSSDCGCPPRGQNITSVANDTQFTFSPAFAKVVFAYNESKYDEMSIAPNDIITELHPVSLGWMKGCLHERRGVFPSTYTRVAKTCPVPGQIFSVSEADEDALGPCERPALDLMAGTTPSVPTAYVPRLDGTKLKMEAVVEFDYTAQEVDELTIRKGDVITDIRTQPGGWWEGCLHGRRGMFPDNFVKIRDKIDNLVLDIMANNEVQLRTGGGRKCKVLYSYQPANDDELELQLNDVIDIVDEVEEGWWRGKLRNRVGVFPSNFVMEITEKQTNGGPGSRKTSATQPPSLTMLKKEENNLGIIIGETDSPASPTGPDSGNPNALDVDLDAPILPPKPVKEVCKVLYPYEAANEDELSLKEGDIITIITKEVQDKGWWKGELRGRIGVFPDNFVAIIPQEEVRKPDRPPMKVSAATPAGKAKDVVTKPTGTTTTSIASNKKPVENSLKSDDKAPPTLTKKPALPPTAKKPQLRAGPQTSVTNTVKKISNEVGGSPEQRLSDLVDGTGGSKMAPVVGSADLDFDGVERGAMLTHPTASRAKAPRRRLPTQLNKDSEIGSELMNGNGEHHDSSLDSSLNSQHNDIDRENGLGPNTVGSLSGIPSVTPPNRNSKEWEKNKAPWMEELKMNQAAKKIQITKPTSSALKHEPVRSKVEIPDSPASPTSPEPVKSGTITFRQHSTGSLSNNIPVTQSSPAAAGSRPQSVHGDVGNARFSTSPSAASSISRPVSMYSPASNEKPSPSSSPSAVSCSATSSFVPMKQFLEVVEKVSKLEQHCEVLTRTVTELSLQVKEEKEKRIQLQQELEKLADLVTQV